MGFITLNAVLLGVIVSIMEETADLDGVDLFGASAISLAVGFGRDLWLGMEPPVWQAALAYTVHAALAGLAVSALMGMSVKRASIAAAWFLAVQALFAVWFGSPSNAWLSSTGRW